MISIIITSYKAKDFIKDCLLSIDNNNIEADYEILLGIDSCEETLKAVENLNIKNLKVFWAEKNVGTYVLRNSLTLKAKYDHYLFFDSDDQMCDNMIKNLLKEKNHNIVRYKYYDIEEKSSLEKMYMKYSDIKEDMDIKPINHHAIGTFFIKKEIFEKLGGFKPFRFSADYEFFLRCENNNFKSKMLDKHLFKRLVRSDSLSGAKETGLRSKKRRDLDLKIRNQKDWSPIEKKIVDLEEIKR